MEHLRNTPRQKKTVQPASRVSTTVGERHGPEVQLMSPNPDTIYLHNMEPYSLSQLQIAPAPCSGPPDTSLKSCRVKYVLRLARWRGWSTVYLSLGICQHVTVSGRAVQTRVLAGPCVGLQRPVTATPADDTQLQYGRSGSTGNGRTEPGRTGRAEEDRACRKGQDRTG